MKKLISIVLTLLVVMSLFSTNAFAAEDTGSADSDGYVVVGVEDVVFSDNLSDENNINLPITFEELIEASSNVTYSNSSYTGSYKSDKYDAGLVGFKYQISFDWEATTNSGDYIFKSISNAKITTYTNYLLLSLSWGDDTVTYSLTKNTFEYSSNKRSVTFYTNYKFTVYDSDDPPSSYDYYKSNQKTINLDNLL